MITFGVGDTVMVKLPEKLKELHDAMFIVFEIQEVLNTIHGESVRILGGSCARVSSNDDSPDNEHYWVCTPDETFNFQTVLMDKLLVVPLGVWNVYSKTHLI